MNIPADFAASATWLTFESDPAGDRVALLRMSETAYRAASFLDHRALGSGPELRHSKWADLAAATPLDVRRDAQFIFHLGNVGSTLISRMLGEIDAVLALREPLLLRTLAEGLGGLVTAPRWEKSEADARVAAVTAWLSRTFRPNQRAIIKATSFVSEIGARLVPPASAALFLFVSRRAYIENILAGPNSRAALSHHTPIRLARLARRCPGLTFEPQLLSPARQAALGWACEMSSLEAAAVALPAGRALFVDFDDFLAAPAAGFAAIAAFFALPIGKEEAGAIAAGPLLRRYSKAPEYEYSPELRRELLAEARQAHGAEIGDALAWLDRLAREHGALAAVLDRAKQ